MKIVDTIKEIARKQYRKWRNQKVTADSQEPSSFGHRTGKEWIRGIRERTDLWDDNVVKALPEMLQMLYRKMEQQVADENIYGLFLGLVDFYEGLSRWYGLTGIAWAEHLGDKELVSVLCEPRKSFSFGDWEHLPVLLKKNDTIWDSALGQLLKKLFKQYEKETIVRWRNDTIGHGAMQQSDSPAFQKELEDKLALLMKILKMVEPQIMAVTYTVDGNGELQCSIDSEATFSLAPFIQYSQGEYRVFDSLLKKEENSYLVLNYRTGERAPEVEPYFFGLADTYHGDTPITLTGDFDDAVFTGQVEAALQHIHEPNRYWKQTHYMNTLLAFIKDNSKGALLLQSPSGTGKSTFAAYIDDLVGHGVKKQHITCRGYAFHRMSYRSRKEFHQALELSFSKAAENEEPFQGRLLPELSDEGPANPQALANFLAKYRELYEKHYGRDKLLLVLDGIDELQAQQTSILNEIPTPDQLTDGVYILVTCRGENLEHTFQKQFLRDYPFTDRTLFQPEKENRELLKVAIKESVICPGRDLTDAEVDTICQYLNNCFTGLPLVRVLLGQTGDMSLLTSGDSLVASYVGRLQSLYGPGYFPPLEKLLCALTLAVEPLPIRLLSAVAFQTPPSGRMLAMMKDITPMLASLRDIGGAKFLLNHPTYAQKIWEMFPDTCQELVEGWKAYLLDITKTQEADYELDTYLASGIQAWSGRVLGQPVLEETMAEVLVEIYQSSRTMQNHTLHFRRMSSILFTLVCSYRQQWTVSGLVFWACRTLDTLIELIGVRLDMGDLASGVQLKTEADSILTVLSRAHKTSIVVNVLYKSYVNLSTLAERVGDAKQGQEYRAMVESLMVESGEGLSDAVKASNIYNTAFASLLRGDVDRAVTLLDQVLSIPTIPATLRINALNLESDAFKSMRNFPDAKSCLEEAEKLAQSLDVATVDDAEVLINTLWHCGRFKLVPEEDWRGAIDLLIETLQIYDRQKRYGQDLDPYRHAKICSDLGRAYCGLDAGNGGYEYKATSLAYFEQGITPYRLALKNNKPFHRASADENYVNAAGGYWYYQETETALALLDELEAMQDPQDEYGKMALANCARARAQILGSSQ